MKQSAAVRPEPSTQRMAAIAHGAALDHTGRVRVEAIPDFDLDRTIFQTLEGVLPRYVMRARIAKDVRWNEADARAERAAYEALQGEPLPAIDPALIAFLVEACDFDVEHADGSFLDHLYFCFEYSARHYPGRDPLVMLLHSILGTGTNTFAMPAAQIPTLRALLDPFVWAQTEAFPSVLRLLYDGGLRRALRDNLHRPDALQQVTMHRVIDNAPLMLSGADLWIALNYQLIHLVDFLPVSNWSVHQNDTSFILFRDLYDLLERAGKREVRLDYRPAAGPRRRVDEPMGLGGRLTTRIPVRLSERMAAKSVRKFSARIGHALDFTLTWA